MRGKYRTDDAERARAQIHNVAVAIHERLGVVVDIFGGAPVRDDEGVLVGVGGFDPGGEAVLEREFSLVFIDRAREIAPRSSTTSWTARPAAIAARWYRDRRRESPATEDSMPVASVSSEMPDSSRQRFQLVDRVQGEAAVHGILFVAPVLHDRRGVRDGDDSAVAARREQFVERRIRRRQSGPATGLGAVGDFEQIADERRAVVAVGQNRDLLFLQSASDLIFLPPGPISSSTSCSRMASARARGGTLASVRSTARSARLRSNSASALALSAWGRS